mgnify:CR=1 FL=1
MKQIVHSIMVCCLTAMFFAACDSDIHIPDGNPAEGDGNSIILDLSSASLPVSRAIDASSSAEVKVDHIDVLIFSEDGTKMHHERVSGSQTGSGTIALAAKRSDFTAGTKYWVQLIANSTADVSVFAADGFTRNTLLGMTQTDDEIHMTGCPGTEGAENVPQTFLMDGVAYPDGETEPDITAAAPVVLNNGNKADDTKLKVTLRRAAAKLVIRIKKGEFVEFNNDTGTLAGYYLRNMPYTTSVVAGVGAEAALRTPFLTDNAYFSWTQDTEDGLYTLITVTAYAYAHTWENESALEKETRLIVNIPMYAILHDADGNYIDADGNIVTEPVKTGYDNSYYQIPVCRGKELKRNTCYEVSLTLNVPGGTNPSEPVVLEPINYSVRDWDEKTIDIGGESDRPAYLSLNEYEMEMHNMKEDRTTLQFTSSSEVTTKITKVYYIDKFGQEQELENISGDEWGVNTGSDRNPNWTNRCTIRITPDEGINGKIDVFGDVPENNAVRYIEFSVTNETGQSRSVTVAQYPLEYITNVQGWYSYRSDFGGTTYELLNGENVTGKEFTSSNRITTRTCGTSWSSNNDNWTYTNSPSNNSFFGSKVAEDAGNGSSDIYYYKWDESWRNGGNWWNPTYYYSYNVAKGDQISGRNNARMYHVQITASSGDYTLGKPRITDGKTDPGSDNAQLVSPSFMIASQLGAVQNADNVTIAASHCEQYVEVAEDGTVYDDWRLPTAAEVKIIMKFQKEGDAIDVVLSGEQYWCASGCIRTSDGEIISNQASPIRCIRDAYDDKKTGNQ